MHIPSNRVRDIERYYLSELRALYPEGELRTFVYMLFEAFLGWDKTQFLLHRDDTINQSDLLRFHWAAEDLKHHRPIQHIVGHTHFCSLRIDVSPDALIPRPETEEIVQSLILSLHPAPAAVLDLCTGSGCIAIALKHHFPTAEVTAVDISPAVLALAQHNARQNNTEITFRQTDLLDPAQLAALPCPYDLIVSNPPYVMERERADMKPNVLDYDPAQALFVPDSDPLLFYRAIGQYAVRSLAPGGQLVVEINQALAAETSQLFGTLGFDTRIHDDFRGNPRSITATLPSR